MSKQTEIFTRFNVYFFASDRSKVHDHIRNLTFNQIIERFNRRFKRADKDGNDLLDRDEFADFLHPREYIIRGGSVQIIEQFRLPSCFTVCVRVADDVPHMVDIVVDETLQEMDRDKDNKIGLDEYLGEFRGQIYNV